MSGTILVTGGAGFIGANFVHTVRERDFAPVVNLDALTYADNLESLASLADDDAHTFVRGSIGDHALVATLLREHRPRAVVNFARILDVLGLRDDAARFFDQVLPWVRGREAHSYCVWLAGYSLGRGASASARSARPTPAPLCRRCATARRTAWCPWRPRATACR